MNTKQRKKGGQFASKEEVNQFSAKQYEALDASPLVVQALGLKYWPALGEGLKIEPDVAAVYEAARETANEVAWIRAWDFFWHLGLVLLGLYVAYEHDLRIANLYKDIPRNWGEVGIAAIFAIGYWVKCYRRGQRLNKGHDAFIKLLNLPKREEIAQRS